MEPLNVASDPAASKKGEPSERAPSTGARRRDSSVVERRVPNARETVITLPDGESAEFDFEPHDTIPAPTWFEDEISTPPKT